MAVACSQTGFEFGSATNAALKMALIPCRNLQDKFLRSKTKGHHSQTDHKSVHQYIMWLKPSKRETVHDLSQRDHFKQFNNIKIKFTYVSLINNYRTNDPP